MIWRGDAVVQASQAVDGHPPGPITIGCIWKPSLRVASLHTETSYRINRGLCPLYLRYGTAQKDVQPQRPKKQRNLKAYKAVLPVLYFLYCQERTDALHSLHLALALSGVAGLRSYSTNWSWWFQNKTAWKHWSQYTCKTHVLCVYDSSVYVKSSVHTVLLRSTLSRWYRNR